MGGFSSTNNLFIGTIFYVGCLLGLDPDLSPDEQQEKARLIAQVLELQNTLDGMLLTLKMK